MNPPAASAIHGQPHPSPHRAHARAWATWFGLIGAPLAWSLQLLLNASIGAHGCYPGDAPLAEPIWANTTSVMAVVEIAAMLVCTGALWCAWHSWRRTREERPGSAHHLMEAGDGRTRFMAMAGMLTSCQMLVAVVLSTISALAVPGCGGAV
jgi:hypothetical protein